MISFLNNLFYGEYWFISWGIIILLFVIGIAVQLPAIIKSIREKKNK